MLRRSLLALVLLTTSAGAATADSITVDEILYASGGVADASLLSGTLDMTYSGGILTIVAKNTSADGAGSGAGILLTGIAFELPTGVSISGGSVTMGTSTAVNFVAPASGNISSEWGYDNYQLNSGAFLNNAYFSYTTVVASMVSMTTSQFASGSLGDPGHLGGPDFGAISASETDAGGQEAILDSIRIQLALSGAVPSNLVDVIQSGNVGISFGSPNTTTVPEPSSLSLLVFGAAALGSRVRFRLQR